MYNYLYFRLLFNSWLTDESGWDQFDSVFRIDYSQEERTLKNFLAEELPEVKELWIKVDDLEKILKNLKICWIIDGYNDKSVESIQLLDSLDKQFNINHHSVIVTKTSDECSANADVLYVETLYCINLIKEGHIKRMDVLGTLIKCG